MGTTQPFYLDIDLNKNRLLNAAYQLVNTFPTNPVKGQFCYLIDSIRGYQGNIPYYYNGRDWIAYGSGGGISIGFSGIVKSSSGVLSPATSTDITAFTLVGLITSNTSQLLETDSILEAFGKLQAQINARSIYFSTGAVDELLPELIKSTDSITVPSLKVVLHDNPNFRGVATKYTISSSTFTVPRDGNNNYVVVNYNSGAPVFQVISNKSLINMSNIVAVYIVWNVTGEIHSIGFDNKGEGLSNKIDRSILNTVPYRRSIDGGLIISVDGTRHIVISSSEVYSGTTPINVLAYSSINDSLIEVYHSAGMWEYNKIPSGGVYNNTLYDNGTSLVSAGSNKYVVRWVYRTIGDDKECFIVYGRGEYNTYLSAQSEPVPPVPNIVNNHGLLVGRIIVQYGAIGVAESAFGVSFIASQVTNHNELSGKQGGDELTNEYYHTTLSQNLTIKSLDELNSIGFVKRDGQGSFSIETGGITVLAKQTYYLEYSLPENVSNTVQYFYAWSKSSTAMSPIRSNSTSGIQNENEVCPIVAPLTGTIKRAIAVIKGAGVQNGSVTFPCYLQTELYKDGYDTEGVMDRVDFPILNGDVAIFAPGDTNRTVEIGGLSIPVTKGDKMGLKFQHLVSTYVAASTVSHVKNIFITLVIEED